MGRRYKEEKRQIIVENRKKNKKEKRNNQTDGHGEESVSEDGAEASKTSYSEDREGSGNKSDEIERKRLQAINMGREDTNADEKDGHVR